MARPGLAEGTKSETGNTIKSTEWIAGIPLPASTLLPVRVGLGPMPTSLKGLNLFFLLLQLNSFSVRGWKSLRKAYLNVPDSLCILAST